LTEPSEVTSFDPDQLQEDFKRYYKDHFDRTILHRIFKNKPFGTREFAVLRMDMNTWVRNRSFENMDVLIEYLTLYPAKGVYIGALYEEPLTREKTIHNTKWMGRELLFDLDMFVRSAGYTCKKQPSLLMILFALISASVILYGCILVVEGTIAGYLTTQHSLSPVIRESQ
jgi:DNA primase catalytic subunit